MLCGCLFPLARFLGWVFLAGFSFSRPYQTTPTHTYTHRKPYTIMVVVLIKDSISQTTKVGLVHDTVLGPPRPCLLLCPLLSLSLSLSPPPSLSRRKKKHIRSHSPKLASVHTHTAPQSPNMKTPPIRHNITPLPLLRTHTHTHTILDPIPQHLLGTQPGQSPPKVAHYNGARQESRGTNPLTTTAAAAVVQTEVKDEEQPANRRSSGGSGGKS